MRRFEFAGPGSAKVRPYLKLGPRWLLRSLGFFFLVIAADAGLSAYLTGYYIFPTRRALGDPTRDLHFRYEAVSFPATDGTKLEGWFVPSPDAKTAVVLLHGADHDRSSMLARAQLLRTHGYAVLLYDARGQGASERRPVTWGWFESRDLLGALDFLRSRGFHNFGCIGSSQGAATIALAAPLLKEVRWAVLECSYSTMRQGFDRQSQAIFNLPGWLSGVFLVPFIEWRAGISFDAVNPREAAEHFACPVLVMNGANDRRVLPEDARDLFSHIPEPKTFWLVPHAGHGNLYKDASVEYERHLLAFISSSENQSSM